MDVEMERKRELQTTTEQTQQMAVEASVCFTITYMIKYNLFTIT